MKATTEQEKTQQIRDFSAALQSKAFEESEIPSIQFQTAVLGSLIEQYLSKIPHFWPTFSNTKEKLSATRGWNLFYYVTTASVLTEVRHVARLETPYTGWEIPPKTKDESNVDAWSYAISPPSLQDTVEHKSSIIGDSQSLYDCPRCTATGYIPCDKCSQKGKTRCQDCSGAGTFRCTTCAGTTTVNKTQTVVKEKKCDACGVNTVMNVIALFDDNPYTRARRCGKCGGRGVIRYKDTESYTAPCKTCRATGEERCKKCRATGLLTCGKCRGNTKLKCTKCKTHKKIVSYLSLERQFSRSSHSENFASPLFAKQLSTVEGDIFVDAAQHEVACLDADHIPDVEIAKIQGNTPTSKVVAQRSALLLKQARKACPPAGRIVEESVVLKRCSSIGFSYNCGRARYQAVCSPTANTFEIPLALLPHISPAAAWMKHRLAEARALAASGDKRDAAVLLAQCRELAAVDPACLSLLSGDLIDIPDDVVSLAEKVTYTSGEVKFYAAAILIFVAGIITSAAATSFVPALLATPFGGVLGYIGWMVGKQTTGHGRGLAPYGNSSPHSQAASITDTSSTSPGSVGVGHQETIIEDVSGFYSSVGDIPEQRKVEREQESSSPDTAKRRPAPSRAIAPDQPKKSKGIGVLRLLLFFIIIGSLVAMGGFNLEFDNAKYTLQTAIDNGDASGAGSAAVRANFAEKGFYASVFVCSLAFMGLFIMNYFRKRSA